MRLTRLSAILSTLLLSLPAFADGVLVTDITSSRVSNYSLPDSDTSIAKIWGGIAGLDCSTDLSDVTSSTCNNCDDDPTTACNPKRVHPSLKLRVYFKVTADISGPVVVGFDNDGFTQITPSYAPSGDLSKDSTGYVEVLWSAICEDASDGDATCFTGGTTELVIGISDSSEPATSERTDIPIVVALPDGDYDLVTCDSVSPSSGICGFYAYPGDEKVYLQDLDPVGTYPTSNNVALKYLRVYYSTTSFSDANYTSSDYVDLEIPDDGVPTPGTVDGLENDVLHYFRSAVVDEAYNVAFLIDVAEIENNADCVAGSIDDQGCLMTATPSKVLGLLTEDVNCFISTAAYGSSFAPEVQTFRNFRNRILLTSSFGRQLNSWYYQYGPKWAKIIHDHPVLKPVARTALYPLLWFAKLSMNTHVFLGVAALLLMISLFVSATAWAGIFCIRRFHN